MLKFVNGMLIVLGKFDYRIEGQQEKKFAKVLEFLSGELMDVRRG